jgi:Methyltransferase domain
MALDAACGTSRFAELLASRGHQVTRVDRSPDMPACAAACPRWRVPPRWAGPAAAVRSFGGRHRLRARSGPLARPPAGTGRIRPPAASRRGPGHLGPAARARHPRPGDQSPRPGWRTVHRGHLPAPVRRLPAGGAESRLPADAGCWQRSACPWRLCTPRVNRGAGPSPSMRRSGANPGRGCGVDHIEADLLYFADERHEVDGGQSLVLLSARAKSRT